MNEAKVVPPMAQGLNNCKELKVVSGVTMLSFIQFLAKESNGVALLTTYSSNAYVGCITSHFQWLFKVGKPRIGLW